MEVSNTEYRTVGTYAVIDWGFRVLHDDGTSNQAGAILRQAPGRCQSRFSLLNPKVAFKFEMLMHTFGITTAGAHRDLSYDALNVQEPADGKHILNFGVFLDIDQFYKKLSSLKVPQTIFLKPSDPGFIQPDPNLRVPSDLWGTTVSGVEYPKPDNPWNWTHELAETLAEGTAGRADAEACS